MASLPPRTAILSKNTKETKIQISLSLDGGPLAYLEDSDHFPASTSSTPSTSTSILGFAPIPDQSAETHASQTSNAQQIWIWTGIGFLDHMLHALAKHAGWSLRVRTKGDLAIDDHHTAEDTLLALGAAFSQALGARTGLARFGTGYAPLDEALARAVIDLSNRPFFVGELPFSDAKIGTLSTQMIHHGLQSFSQAAGVTLHVDVIRGENDHHKAEAVFKALAVAIREAIRRVEGREGEVVSTKGVL